MLEPANVGASAPRKISLRLLPVMAAGYGLAYMDRVNISFAALQMNQDLHFSATVYGTRVHGNQSGASPPGPWCASSEGCGN